MGWETRNGRRYYYQKARDGNTVKSKYIGTGDFAEALASLDTLAKHRRNLERAERELEQNSLEQRKLAKLDQQLADIDSLVRNLTQATLILAGCHRHKGQWRRKREHK